MSDELRMELADCGSPEKIIATILKYHPNLKAPIPIEEIALKVGIAELQQKDVDSFEGALVTDQEKTCGVIITKQGLIEGRRRFTVAHELGHFLIPAHKGNKQCSKSDLREARRETPQQKQEAEANRFAAGILMPKPMFVRDMAKLGEVDVTHVQFLADKYEVSVEAATNNYANYADDKCAFVFSKDGVVRYVRISREFPALSINSGDKLPSQACLNASEFPLGKATGWSESDGSLWLRSEWGKKLGSVLFQSIPQQNGYQLTLLSLESVSADEDNESEDEVGRWEPKFKR